MYPFIVATLLFLPPLPPVPTTPPTGAIPWPVPLLPAIPTQATPSVVLDEPTHSEGFEDQQETIETQIDDWTQPLDYWSTTLENWLGDGGAIPATPGGDFDVGMTPLDDIGSIYEFAAWLGSKIGDLFVYLRGAYIIVQDFPLPIQILVIIIIACATFLLACRMFNFATRLFDLGWTLFNTLIQTIFEIIPG